MEKVHYENSLEYVVIEIDKVSQITWRHNTVYNLSDRKGIDKFKSILAICLSDELYYPYNEVLKTNHLEYFANYLRYYNKSIGFYTQTIVVEKKYMSLSFLKDYSIYYSMGYHEQSKYCRRIHFFQKKFDQEKLENFLLAKDEKLAQASRNNLSNYYLGHIVTKPLKNALIGATLIRCYDEFFDNLYEKELWPNQTYKERKREFTALRWYTTNFFGKPIHFKSLVFQEQDNAVSACATTALWMCFHKLSELFRTKLPAPIVITESAGLNSHSNSQPTGRIFPNSGLEVSQIIKAIDSLHLDLVSDVFNPRDPALIAKERGITNTNIISPWKIKRYAYAYLKLEIPVLLGYIIVGQNGNHLVTLTGFRFEKIAEKKELPYIFPPEENTKIKCEADRIFRLFSHDDQLGPFSKIGFNHTEFKQYVSINWKAKEKFNIAAPTLIIAPVLNTIRLDYNHIEEFATQFQLFLEKTVAIPSFTERLIWDIYLINSNDYKEELINSNLKSRIILRYIQKSFPKYIWIVRLKVIPDNNFSDLANNYKLMDFIFDASESPKGITISQIFYFNEEFRLNFKNFFKKDVVNQIDDLTKNIFNGKKHLSNILQTLSSHESTDNN